MGRHPLASVVLLMLGATVLRAAIPNISGFLALGLPIAMSVGREVGLNPLVCALVVMMTGDAVLYYPVQSGSALVIYERGHVSAGEIAALRALDDRGGVRGDPARRAALLELPGRALDDDDDTGGEMIG